jgi:phosphoacetylglucosamine mutase
MITASHNPAPDNGLKIIDTDGGMLTQAWEPFCARLANAPADGFLGHLQTIAAELKVPFPGAAADAPAKKQRTDSSASSAPVPLVLVGYDTRDSSPRIAQLVREAATALGAVCLDYGMVTTPQLHYYVGVLGKRFRAPGSSPLRVPTAVAYRALFDAFLDLMPDAAAAARGLTVDCANGVGALAFTDLMEHCARRGRALPWALANSPLSPEGRLLPAKVNDQCGAEFVQKLRAWPQGVACLPPPASQAEPQHGAGQPGCAASVHDVEHLYVSVDGDCDRLVLFLPNPHTAAEAEGAHSSGDEAAAAHCRSGPVLLDGDRIGVLMARFLRAWLLEAELDLSLGMVQTPYANGASAAFARGLGVDAVFAHTGVKHLHAVAHRYDVGVYFEANGHGTVLFSEAALTAIDAAAAKADAAAAGMTAGAAADAAIGPAGCAALRLRAITRLVNPYIGDALSDLLATLLLLQLGCVRAVDWAGWYADVPSHMDKVVVPDRTQVVVDDVREDICVAPAGLQGAIAAAVAETGDAQARAFVRPSGTEDIVRVYAEATTVDDAKALCCVVQSLVTQFLSKK